MDVIAITNFFMSFVPDLCIAMIVIGTLLGGVAYLVYAERRIIGWMQLRQGPNVVGPFGLLQPFADAVKLLFKEKIYPQNIHRLIFVLGPMIAFGLVMMGFAVIPIHLLSYDPKDAYVYADINLGILYLMAMSALEVYGLITAGWASNSKYAFYGAIRSVAQMISYELVLAFIMLMIVTITGSMNITEIVERYHNTDIVTKLMMLPMGLVFFIGTLAETNRHPFDLPEAESELVAGYNVEYSSMSFALFFLGEYANMILKSTIITLFFLEGWYPLFDLKIFYMIPPFIMFCGKVAVLLFIFIWIRAALPRYRYDQLMRICWKLFLPVTFTWYIVIVCRVFFSAHPELLESMINAIHNIA